MRKALFICIIIMLAMMSCTERKFNNPAEPDVILENLVPPENLQINVVDEDVLELTWEDKCDVEDSFQIFRKVGNKEYTLIKTVPANSNIWLDNSVELGNTYSYRIYTANENYRSLNAIESSFVYTLYPPTNLKIEALDDNSIKLSWENSNHFAEGYKIDKRLGNDEWQENFASVSSNINSWDYEISETDNSAITWRVKSCYKSLHSGNSNELSLKVANPTFSEKSGNYSEAFDLTLDCVSHKAQIRYTTDGSPPVSSSPLYNQAIQVNRNLNIQARAFKNGWHNSDIVAANYSFKVATPTFNLDEGSYHTPQSVIISCTTPLAQIHYSTDGSTPTSFSAIYDGPIQIDTAITLKAKAFKNGWTDSETVSCNYVIVPAGVVYVPGGTFTMGNTRGGGNSNELPTHSVTLNPFFIGKHQVTQGEYQAIMGINPAHSYGEGSNYPVYNISWYDAIKYCNLRSIHEELTPVYSIGGSTNPGDWGTVPSLNNATWNAVTCNWNADGYRLLTEAEWEYAARGAADNPDYLYSGSDIIGEVAWYDYNSDNTTNPVGLRVANGLGIYDMSGNVSEWCWDWHDSSYYSYSPSENPTGPSDGLNRMLRGGSWYNTSNNNRVSYRNCSIPNLRYNTIGLRICRAIN